MNKLIDKLERKIGKYAISNLTLYIIGAYVVGYVLSFTGQLDAFTLNPYYIFEEYQVWRLLTWLFVPPRTNILFAVIMLFVYYQLGSVLERQWGAFRFNLYIFSGIIFTCIGAILLYFITVGNGANPVEAGYRISAAFSTYYINMSIFLAFATLFPDMQMLLYFIIPVKIKWLAYLDVALLAWDFINSGLAGKITITMSLLNFILFFVSSRNFKRVSPKEVHRRREFKRSVNSARSARGNNSSGSFNGFSSVAKHKCAICGQTEKDNDMLEFRFCSKCNGNYEYCSEHLFTHEHIK